MCDSRGCRSPNPLSDSWDPDLELSDWVFCSEDGVNPDEKDDLCPSDVFHANSVPPNADDFGKSSEAALCRSGDLGNVGAPGSNARPQMELCDNDHNLVVQGVDPNRRLPRHGKNRIVKGFGEQSKDKYPDAFDSYRYDKASIAFHCLRCMGYHGISLHDICRVSGIIELRAAKSEICLTRRNRAAHRRKPCVFHWLDENFPRISALYILVVREVLGNTSGVKPRGRKKKVKLTSSNS
jgi:hypothetical protein